MRGAQGAAAPQLASPSIAMYASFLAALTEYQAEGRHLELPADVLADASAFAGYVAALRSGGARPGEPDLFLAALRGEPAPEPYPDGYVPQTTLWWAAGDEYLGRLTVRHHLTPHLRVEGGHIGYEVRPSARRQGHATAMLAAGLAVAAGLGIDPAHLDCEAANMASIRVIQRNGGRLEREERGSLYFVVPTGRHG